MKRTVTLLVTVVVIVGMIGAAPAAAAGDAIANEEEEDDEQDIEPGERLSGVVGVQEAELDGEMSERTFGVQIAGAASDDATAEVVGEQLDDVEERIGDLEERQEELEEDREDGEISDGEYRAEMAAIAAEKRTAERLANQSADTAGELPEEVIGDHVDVDSIQTLQDRASELGGEEIAAIAQDIAGPDVGESVIDDPVDAAPDDVGPDGAGDAQEQTGDDEQPDDASEQDSDEDHDGDDEGDEGGNDNESSAGNGGN